MSAMSSHILNYSFWILIGQQGFAQVRHRAFFSIMSGLTRIQYLDVSMKIYNRNTTHIVHVLFSKLYCVITTVLLCKYR